MQLGGNGGPKSDPALVRRARKELGDPEGALRDVFYDEQDDKLVYVSNKGRVEELTSDRLVDLLDEKVHPFVMRGKGEDAFPTEEHFPRGDASLIVQRPDKCEQVRPINGLSRVALFRPDGSLSERPGFDHETGYWITDTDTGTHDVKPTPARLKEAKRILDEVFGEFPWVGPNSYINYIGALMTPLLVAVYPPAYMGCALSGSNPGDGKTILATTAQMLYGWPDSAVVCRRGAEENEKTIVAKLREVGGAPVTVIDNVRGEFGSAALESAMTSRWSEVRGLGEGNLTRIKNDAMIFVTGNNLQLAGDMQRRVFWARLDGGGKQDKRTNYKVGVVSDYVKAHRNEVLHALYVIVRNGLEKRGIIKPSGTSSFSAWRDFVGHALGLAGIPGTFAAPEEGQMSSGDADAEEFLQAVREEFEGKPWTTKALIGRLNGSNAGPLFDSLPDEFKKAADDGKLQTVGKKLGNWLGSLKGRNLNGYVLRDTGKKDHNAVLWMVEAPIVKRRLRRVS
jgi:hypothetical protein